MSDERLPLAADTGEACDALPVGFCARARNRFGRGDSASPHEAFRFFASALVTSESLDEDEDEDNGGPPKFAELPELEAVD